MGIGTNLLIDDEEDIRLVAETSLSAVGGMRVLVAACGADGLELARKERPDAILLDVMMPRLDGPATLKALREDPVTAKIPVVFMTAKAQPSEITRLLGLGAHGVLTKPFDPLELPARVTALVEKGTA